MMACVMAPALPTMDLTTLASQLALELHRASRREPAQAFCDWALESLKAKLPFDSAFWASGHVSPQGVPVVHNVVLHRQPAQLLVDYQAIGPSDPVLAAALRQPGQPLAADSREWAPPQALPYLQHYGIAHTLATTTVDPNTRLTTGISLYRSDPRHPFGTVEQHLMQAVFPHLIEARLQNHLFHLAQATAPRPASPWCAAAADATGLLHHADDAFVRLVRREWPDWTGPRVPAPLSALWAHEHPGRHVGQHLVGRADRLGDLNLLRVRPVQPVDRLTPREREVALFTAQGLTHKEIALRLDLSPATVRTHLTSSYRRLGVKSKAQLASWVIGVE